MKRINQQDAEVFISNLQLVHPDHVGKGKKLSAPSRNRHLKYCKRLFGIAQEWGYIRINPFKPISVQKSKIADWYYISPIEFNSILKNMPPIRKRVKIEIPNIRVKALYAVMYGCGLRYGEVVNLRWDSQNIDFINNKIHIKNRNGNKNIPPFSVKDFEERSIRMPTWVVKLLLQLKEESQNNCPFVFLTKERLDRVKIKWQKLRKENREDEWENHMMLNNVLRNFKLHCRRAGIITNLKLTIHGLRKSYATNVANNNIPAVTLKKLMGHSSIQTTMEYYLKSSDENEEKAVEVLEEIMKVG